ncbi:hypothetical protein B1C78_11035 [Thioalkalivibrio denitrificans]|uniref:Uncharacterized protein n=1 Tax=Thioalkalivibrio denitrificans TaxID=108003 RepID=A0A1V3NFB2_9GAMM|nr:hypothetical protein [Thioalkalivibrio denitrificans]OOG23542.1 hypothetical protein B1C78_11035 [Thioalkalivibrio denitrificans]
MDITEQRPIIMNPRQFWRGAVGLAFFTLLLIPLFAPVFDGRSGMEAADDLFNELSKGSADYIDETQAIAEQFRGTIIATTVRLDEADRAPVRHVLEHAGIPFEPQPLGVAIEADLGQILEAALVDARDLFYLRDDEVEARHDGKPARNVLYRWHRFLLRLDDALTAEGRHSDARGVARVNNRAVEPSYNFAGIEPIHLTDRLGITVFLLVFYVVYTVWYGVSILFVFEGLGITATKGLKQEK